MKLVELSTILQNYCHEGRSLDKVIITYDGNHLMLDRVEVKPGIDEEVVIDLKREADFN